MILPIENIFIIEAGKRKMTIWPKPNVSENCGRQEANMVYIKMKG